MSSAYPEEYTEKWNTSTQLTTILHNKKAKKHYTTICDDKDKYFNKDKTEANLNKNVLIKCIPISNASEEEKELTILKKNKNKKRKGDKKKVQNNENLKTDKTIFKTEKLYTETFDVNDKDVNKERTVNSNSNKDEWTRKIPITNSLKGDSLFKKKKKKKKVDKKMVQNDEDSINNKDTLNVDEFYDETLHDNYQHLNKDHTRDSNLYKDEWTRRNPIENASEGDSLVKKRKKKKKGDTQMEQNNKATLKVEKFYNETLDDNDKHLNKAVTRDSYLNKDEWIRRILIANASESDSLFKKKNKKKNGEKKMVHKYKHFKNDKATLKVEPFKNETSDDNVKNLNKINLSASNLKKEDLITRIQIANNSEDDKELKLLQKLIMKKEKKTNQKIQLIYNLESDAVRINQEASNTDECTRMVSDFNESPNKNYNYSAATSDLECVNVLLKSPLKNIKKKKKKSKMTIKEDTESSKYESIQNNFKNMEYPNKDISEEKSNEIHYGSAMINTTYNSRISEVHEQYPKLFQKLLKKKKKEKKKSIKVVKSKEVISLKKTNKHKRQTSDKEYSKNDTPQSVDIDVETYVSKNYIDKYGGKKLEFFDSLDDQTSEYRTMTDTDTGMYFGKYYNETSNNAYGVNSHKNVLSGNTSLQCDVCFKTFTIRSKLVRHKRMHTGEKPYTCNVCGQSFSRQDILVTHNRTHTGEKPYACNVCGQSFSHKSTLIIHNRTHTGVKPYACNVCGQSFSLQETLVKHNRTHTGEKPYACNVCGKSFSQQGYLVTHYRIHTGERPFECGHCEKKFSSSSDCKKHTRRVHTKCL